MYRKMECFVSDCHVPATNGRNGVKNIFQVFFFRLQKFGRLVRL